MQRPVPTSGPGAAGAEPDLASLRQAEAQYRWLFAHNPAPMFIYRRDTLALLAFNDAFLALYGYSAEQALQLRLTDLYLPEDQAEVVRRVAAMSGLVNAGEWRHLRRDGSIMHTVVQSHQIEHQGHACRFGVITDVTPLKRGQQRDLRRLALMERLARGDPLECLLDQLARDHEAMFPGSLCSLLLLNAAGTHLLHGAAPSLPADFCRAIHGQPIGPTQGSCGAACWTGQRVVVDDIDGHPNWVPCRDLARAAGVRACWSEPIAGTAGRVLGSFAVYRREPAQPTAEELAHMQFAVQLAATAITQGSTTRALRESDRRLRGILHAIPDLVFLKDVDGVYQSCNHAFERFVDRREDQIVGCVDADITDAESAHQYRQADAQALQQRAPLVAERWLEFKRDGYRGLFEVVKTPLFDDAGKALGVLGVARDITDSRRHEQRIQALNRSYAVLSAANEAVVRLRDRATLFAELCRIAVDVGDFTLAWVGTHDAADNAVRPLAWAGAGQYHLHDLRLPVPPGHEGPVPDAFHTGRPQVVPDIALEPTLAHRREGLLAAGLRSLAVFPVTTAADCWYCLVVYSGSVDHFDAEQVALLSRLAQDVEFALQFIAAEQAQREDRNFREQLIESVAGLFFAIDTRRRIVLWNRRMEEVSGYPADVLASRDVADFFEGADRVQVAERLQQAFEHGEAQGEASLVGQDGTRRPYLLVVRRLDMAPGPLLVATGIDIGDRVRSEHELARYRDQLEDLVRQRTAELEAVNARLHREDRRLRSMLDLSQRASTLDEATIFQQGLAEILALTGSSLGCVRSVGADGRTLQLQAWDGSEAPPPPDFARHVLAMGAVCTADGDAAATLSGCTDGIARVIGAPVFDGGQAVMVVCAANKDVPYDEVDQRELQMLAADLWQIVRRRRIEIELGRAKAAADAGSLAKSAFLANMSHEIRTPMNAIIGFAHLLRRDPLSPRQQDHLGKITDAGQHLLQVINDILDFSKIEAHKLALEDVDFTLRDSLQRVLAMQTDAARAKRLRLTLDVDPRCPDELHGDRLRLEQILLNLLSNAVKFTPRGQVELRVRLQRPGVQQVRLRFEVSDTGIGLSSEQLARVFEAFAQADASTTRRFGGTGLGLAISKRLAQLMQGHIGADSRPGVGSTFWVELPLRRSAATTAPAAPAPEPPAGAAPARDVLQGRHILVVEDNPINQEVASTLLGALGAGVELAGSGEEALRRFDPQRHDLILMDVQMPGMDGLRATAALRARAGGERVPIIAMTANAFAEDRALCLASGMNDYLAKPVEPQALEQCLLRWLQAAPAAAVDADTLLRGRLEALDVLDTAGPLSRLRGSWALYLRTLRMFVSHHGQDTARLDALAVSGDTTALRALAHSISGAAATVGAVEVQHRAQALQVALTAASGAPSPLPAPDLGRPLAEALQRCLQQVRAALGDDLPGSTGGTVPDGPALVPELSAVDPGALRAVLDELEPLLKAHDTAALALFERQRALLEAALGSEARVLGQQLRSFSFGPAQQTLAAARQRCADADAGAGDQPA